MYPDMYPDWMTSCSSTARSLCPHFSVKQHFVVRCLKGPSLCVDFTFVKKKWASLRE